MPQGRSAEDVKNGGNGYIPISLQYSDYTAEHAREVSLAGGDRLEKSANRSYKGKSVKTVNKTDLETVVEPSALLPMQLPADMMTVELQKEDMPFDMECYVDADGNVYGFAYGLNWSGRIDDHRVEKYAPVLEKN